MDVIAEHFLSTLPKKPYCSNDYTAGVRILSKDIAKDMLYIQPNGPTHRRWLIFDLDRQGATIHDIPWIDCNQPAPHIITARYDDHGSQHYMYLTDPSIRTALNARVKPQAYCAAVEAALGESLGADPLYSGLITRNPLVKHWNTSYSGFYGIKMPLSYTLSELADNLDLIYANKKTRIIAGLGRNCDLFDALRHWAYKAIRAYYDKPLQAYHEWHGNVVEQARNMCANICAGHSEGMLKDSETLSVARSVSKWVWERMNKRSYDAWRQHISRLGGKARARTTNMSALAATAAAKRDMSALGQGRAEGSIDLQSERQRKPWELLGISRRAYYYRKAAGKLS